MDVAAWLRSLGLEQYEPAFRENDIDSRVLPKLTNEDLKDIGVTSVGHRRRLLEAIAALQGEADRSGDRPIPTDERASSSRQGLAATPAPSPTSRTATSRRRSSCRPSPATCATRSATVTSSSCSWSASWRWTTPP